jgi:excisionase family DNA binding protein
MTLNPNQIENAPYTAAQRPPDHISRDELLTVAEVAQLLRVPASWVYERTRLRGIARMPHFKLGKYLRFSEAEVREWLERTRGI